MAFIVLYRSEYNPYFKTDSRLFPDVEFLVQLLQHLPDARTRLIRRYGLYSSRSRGTWMRKPWLTRLAPEGWVEQHEQPALRLNGTAEDSLGQSVSARASRSAWARLLAKIDEIDALRCSRCGSPMKVLAVITDPSQGRRILLHFIKTGVAPWAGLYAAPPGLWIASVS
jgi:hypothetical protein